MKEITENGQVYVVSDGYPTPPYEKYIKNRGIPASVETVDEKIEALKTQIESLTKRFEDANVLPKEAALVEG